MEEGWYDKVQFIDVNYSSTTHDQNRAAREQQTWRRTVNRLASRIVYVRRAPVRTVELRGVGVLNRVGRRQYLADGLESFGRLRIINEDRIKAHNGFGFHSHKGLEIFTYMVRGELKQ